MLCLFDLKNTKKCESWAKEYKMDRSFAARTLQLANLAPDIVKMIWENRQPVNLTLDKLRRSIPDSWEEQRKLFLGE